MWTNGARSGALELAGRRPEGRRLDGTEGAPPSSELEDMSDRARVKALFEQHVDWVWQLVRRLGLSESDAEDVTQQVFITVSRRLRDVEPGRERGFLAATAARLVANARRALRRKREDFVDVERIDDALSADELLERARARDLAERILDAMEFELRAVFVLYELQEMTILEIAEALSLPRGTVASRLRRARAEFQKRAAHAVRKEGSR